MVDCKTFEEFQSKFVYLYEKYTPLCKVTHEDFIISDVEKEVDVEHETFSCAKVIRKEKRSHKTPITFDEFKKLTMMDLVVKEAVYATVEYDTKEHNFLQFTGGYYFDKTKGDIEITESFNTIEQLDAAVIN